MLQKVNVASPVYFAPLPRDTGHSDMTNPAFVVNVWVLRAGDGLCSHFAFATISKKRSDSQETQKRKAKSGSFGNQLRQSGPF